jgi:hypothetical protein
MIFKKELTEKYSVVEATSTVTGKFSIYGKPADIAEAKKVLEKELTEDELSGRESEDKVRLKVQSLIDSKKLKAAILYAGNTVYGFEALMKDVDRIVKGGVSKLTNALYHFFMMKFTIAHYNKAGWIQSYPTLKDVLAVLKSKKASTADGQKLQKAMIEKLKEAAPKEKTNIAKLRG